MFPPPLNELNMNRSAWIIPKRHFRTSNVELLHKNKSITVIKASIMYSRYCEREIDRASVIAYIWYSIHSSDQSHIYNKIMLSFHL